jgi:hypothetical protein
MSGPRHGNAEIDPGQLSCLPEAPCTGIIFDDVRYFGNRGDGGDRHHQPGAFRCSNVEGAASPGRHCHSEFWTENDSDGSKTTVQIPKGWQSVAAAGSVGYRMTVSPRRARHRRGLRDGHAALRGRAVHRRGVRCAGTVPHHTGRRRMPRGAIGNHRGRES